MHTFRYTFYSSLDDDALATLQSVLDQLVTASGAQVTVDKELQCLSIHVSWGQIPLPIRDLRERFLADVCWDALQCAFDFKHDHFPDGLSTEELVYRDGPNRRCHTCGSYEPGTHHGHFILDNQPPVALEETTPRRFYWHCQDCAFRQAKEVWEYLMAGPTVVTGYRCPSCDAWHDEQPTSFVSPLPVYAEQIPAHDRSKRVDFSSDQCVVDGEHFFILGNLDVPMRDSKESLQWTVWTTLSENNFKRASGVWHTPGRESEPPYFGWLSNQIPGYPTTLSIKTLVHTQPVGIRPRIEVIEEGHPLAIDQRNGISSDRFADLIHAALHVTVNGVEMEFSEDTTFWDVEGVPVTLAAGQGVPYSAAWDTVPPRPFPSESVRRNGEELTRTEFDRLVASLKQTS